VRQLNVFFLSLDGKLEGLDSLLELRLGRVKTTREV
jgi:hypothetical protein